MNIRAYFAQNLIELGILLSLELRLSHITLPAGAVPADKRLLIVLLALPALLLSSLDLVLPGK